MEKFKTTLIIPHKYGQIELKFTLPTRPIENGDIILPMESKATLKLKIKKVLSSIYNDQFIISTRHITLHKITEISNSFKKTKQKEFELIVVIPKFNLQKRIPESRAEKIFNDIRYNYQEIYLTTEDKSLVEIIKIVYQLNKSKIIITVKAPYAIDKQTLIKYGWLAIKQS